jgi:hypothetical protein
MDIDTQTITKTFYTIDECNNPITVSIEVCLDYVKIYDSRHRYFYKHSKNMYHHPSKYFNLTLDEDLEIKYEWINHNICMYLSGGGWDDEDFMESLDPNIHLGIMEKEIKEVEEQLSALNIKASSVKDLYPMSISMV